MNMYQHWKNQVKLVLYTGLAAIVYAGCADSVPRQEQKPVSVQKQIQTPKYSFSNFGELSLGLLNSSEHHPVAVGDVDGDGDLDLIVGESNQILIFENRIPQKNKMKELPQGSFP